MEFESTPMLVDTVNDAAEACAGDAQRDPLGAGAEFLCTGLSANTERAVRSDMAIYRAWCREQGVQALPGMPGPLPRSSTRCRSTVHRRRCGATSPALIS